MTDDPTAFDDWLTELYAELQGSDRACAVIAAVTLDDSLKVILQKHLLPARKPKEDRLLGRSGVVDTFSSRIELATRLGLITDKLQSALDDLREIRNIAAHRAHFAFSIDAVVERVRRMDAALTPNTHLPQGLIQELGDSIKSRFVACALLLALALEHASDETPQVKAPTQDYLSLKLRWNLVK